MKGGLSESNRLLRGGEFASIPRGRDDGYFFELRCALMQKAAQLYEPAASAFSSSFST